MNRLLKEARRRLERKDFDVQRLITRARSLKEDLVAIAFPDVLGQPFVNWFIDLATVDSAIEKAIHDPDHAADWLTRAKKAKDRIERGLKAVKA